LAMTWFNKVVLPEPDGALKIRILPFFIVVSFCHQQSAFSYQQLADR